MEQPVCVLIVDDSAFVRLTLTDRVVSLPEAASTLIELVEWR